MKTVRFWLSLIAVILIIGSHVDTRAQATTHSVVLTWTQSPNPNCTPTACPITGNKVYRATTSGGEGSTPYASLASPVTTFTDTAVSSGVTYFYQVTAVNVNGESAKSNEISAVIPLAVAPNPPSGLTGVVQ